MDPIPIFIPCPLCEGHGRLRERASGPRTRSCSECCGSGLRATSAGQVIRGLLEVAGLEELMPDA
jgi:hypothetical protein